MEAAAQAGSRPAAVLVILSCGTGTGDLSASGNPLISTPRLDRLAKESVRFTDFHGAPLAVPARAALLTGRLPARSGIWQSSGGRAHLSAPDLTISSAFAKAGWRCSVFGAWGLGDVAPCRPADHGFAVSLVHRGPILGCAGDFPENTGTNDTLLENGKPVAGAGWCMDRWQEAARRFLLTENAPRFCLLAPSVPHFPFSQPPDSALANEKDASWPDAGFAAHVRELDRLTGAMLDALEGGRILDSTLIIFTSVTGTAAGWDDRTQTGYSYGLRGAAGSSAEGGHRVPCFVRWPAGGIGGPEKGRDVTVTASLLDILPTLAALCGAPLPADAGLDGRSLEPLLRNTSEPSAEWRDRIILTDAQNTPQIIPWRNSALMQDRWRLLQGRELYRIDTDPGQRHDIASQNPDVAGRLRSAGESLWKSLETPPPPVAWTIDSTPVLLTAQEWHSRGAAKIETKADIARGVRCQGFWPVNVITAGEYSVTLRRWPPGDERGIAESLFIPIAARLHVGNIERILPWKEGMNEAVFQLPLPAGPAELRAVFEGPDNDTCGAYFVAIAPYVKPPEPEKKPRRPRD